MAIGTAYDAGSCGVATEKSCIVGCSAEWAVVARDRVRRARDGWERMCFPAGMSPALSIRLPSGGRHRCRWMAALAGTWFLTSVTALALAADSEPDSDRFAGFEEVEFNWKHADLCEATHQIALALDIRIDRDLRVMRDITYRSPAKVPVGDLDRQAPHAGRRRLEPGPGLVDDR